MNKRDIQEWLIDNYWIWFYPLVCIVFFAGWLAIDHWIGREAAWAFVVVGGLVFAIGEVRCDE